MTLESLDPQGMEVEFEGPMGIFRGAEEVSAEDLLRGLAELTAEAHKRGLLSPPEGTVVAQVFAHCPDCLHHLVGRPLGGRDESRPWS